MFLRRVCSGAPELPSGGVVKASYLFNVRLHKLQLPLSPPDLAETRTRLSKPFLLVAAGIPAKGSPPPLRTQIRQLAKRSVYSYLDFYQIAILLLVIFASRASNCLGYFWYC